MARGGGLTKGLRLGLLAGVGLAALRAARARRAQLPTVTPPTWPPLPSAVGTEPPAAVSSVGPAAAPAVEAAAAEHGTAALVAEAAVLEAAGITEAAEVDEEAVLATRRQEAGAPGQADEVRSAWGPPPPAGAAPPLGEAPWAADLLDDLEPGFDPPGGAAPSEDLEGTILAEEAALEAERLEAEQLELARLERTRLMGEEEAAGLAQREAERQDALVRFAAQRREAEALLALQEERAAKAAEGASDGQERAATAADPLGGRTEELPGSALDGDMWREEVGDLDPWAHRREDQLPEPTLEPLVPDEAVADLYEEPAWALSVEPEPWEEPDLEPARDFEPEPEPAPGSESTAPVPAGGTAEGDQTGLEVGTRQPLMAADLESGLGDGASAQPELNEDDDPAEPLSAWPAAPTEAWPADDAEDTEDSEVEPALEVQWAGGSEGSLRAEGVDDSEGLELVEQWPPRVGGLGKPESQPDDRRDVALDEEDEADRQPAADEVDEVDEIDEVDEVDEVSTIGGSPVTSSGRRPIMASDFDDVLPPEPLEAPAPADLGPQRRSGAPRVPLKARRLGSEDDQETEAVEVPTEAASIQPPPDPPAEPARKTAKKAAKKTAKKVVKARPDKAKPAPAPARPVKRASPPPASVPAKVAKPVSVTKKASTTTTKQAAAAPQPAPKKVSSRKKKPGVLWVEPVGGVCPRSHPVKASLSSGIFHVVGGLFYERSKADRCYRDAAAASADGLRQAKR